MFRLLSPALGRGLLRAAARRRRVCSAHLLPGPAAGRAPDVEVPRSRVAPPGGGSGLLPQLAGEGCGPGGARGAGGAGALGALAAALAWFSKPAAEEEEEEEERRGAGGAAARDAADEAEAEIIQLLKRAKVRRPRRAVPSPGCGRLPGGSAGAGARRWVGRGPGALPEPLQRDGSAGTALSASCEPAQPAGLAERTFHVQCVTSRK